MESVTESLSAETLSAETPLTLPFSLQDALHGALKDVVRGVLVRYLPTRDVRSLALTCVRAHVVVGQVLKNRKKTRTRQMARVRKQSRSTNPRQPQPQPQFHHQYHLVRVGRDRRMQCRHINYLRMFKLFLATKLGIRAEKLVVRTNDRGQLKVYLVEDGVVVKRLKQLNGRGIVAVYAAFNRG